jgi:N-acetylglucosaminyldiphosphoundecaprenol N-acetyl-beta-D-mannosaminyltransferase
MGAPSMTTQAPARIAKREAGESGRALSVLGVPFTLCEFDVVVERVRDMLATGEAHQLVLANAHTLNLAYDDPAYHGVLSEADLVLRDGVGVELAARLAGVDVGHNFVGTDFVPALLEALGPDEVRVFLFGGHPGVTEEAARRLAARGSHVRVVGAAPGYGAFERVVQQVHATRPDVLLVALGNPLQEQWIDEHLVQLGVPVSIGVGALFDYLAGRVPRAPRWVLRLRAEWLFRLLVEPRRLWRRYVMGNPRFVWRVISSRRREQ